jgi:hypothetical protein
MSHQLSAIAPAPRPHHWPPALALLLFWMLLAPPLAAAPAAVPLSDAKVEALVEALRLAAPPASADPGLYSDWRVKPDNISRWSQRCLEQPVTPEQFAADPALARRVLICVIKPVLVEQLTASDHNEIIAVQRVAAWWMTGDPNQYRSGSSSYTLRVLEAYLRFF